MHLVRFLYVLEAAWVVVSSPTCLRTPLEGRHPEYDQVQALARSAKKTALAALTAQNGTGSCTPENIKIRREWDALTPFERKDYSRAVLCLQSSPPLTPSTFGSGIKTRFDDFIATHMNQTNTIHYTGSFLSWHRYFIYLHEQALIEECGYKGTLPYWNWAKTAITGLHASPLFDGSETSLSGDGAYIANKSALNMAGDSTTLESLWLPAGTGGGCVTSGPFVNYTVNLGPISLIVPGGGAEENPNNDTGLFSWNPRCLKRDFTDYINQHYCNASNVLDVLTRYDDVGRFQQLFQGTSPKTMPGGTTIGVHGGGHFSLGGDPGRDLFVSPGEPAFFAHHASIDRVWWIWQMQDAASRVGGDNAIAGTNTFMDSPPSANTTADDWVNYGFAAGPPRQIRDLLSTTAGPFCYVYE